MKLIIIAHKFKQQSRYQQDISEAKHVRKQIKGISSDCSARQKTFEVGKVCSICTYYGSLSSLVEQPSKVLVRSLPARWNPSL